jgi:hypothetical protein
MVVSSITLSPAVTDDGRGGRGGASQRPQLPARALSMPAKVPWSHVQRLSGSGVPRGVA